MALLNLPSAVLYWKASPRYVKGAAEISICHQSLLGLCKLTVQHFVVLVLDLVIDELLALNAVVRKTASDRRKTLSLRIVRREARENTRSTYIKPSAFDNAICRSLQGGPITGLGEHRFDIFP